MADATVMSRDRSLLFVITSLDHGGAQNQVVALARKLAIRAWDVHCVSLLEPVAFVDKLEAAGVTVASLGMTQGVPQIRAVTRLAEIYRSGRPSVVHSHMIHANILARVARLLTPVPLLVSTAHSIDEGGRWRELAYRLTDPLADLTTNVSRAGLERYRQVGAVPARKSIVVPNGVDLSSFKRSNEARVSVRRELELGEGFVWLAAGRLTDAKDYPTMLEAFVQSSTGSNLLIAGQGELEGELRRIATDLGLGQRVRFLGLRNDIPALISAADAFVMSSKLEGLPLALIEAAAGGLPAVATDVGGIGEVMTPQSGLLVPVGDREALSAAMVELERLPEDVLVGMGNAAREFVVAKYDINNIVDEWERLFDRGLVSSEGRSRRMGRGNLFTITTD